MDTETVDELIQRHKKENKDLIATITGLKKQATKKTRKSVLSKCQELEDNLKKKHAKELASLENPDEQTGAQEELTPEQLLAQLSVEKEVEAPAEESTNEMSSQSQSQPGPKRRNRQKERLAKRKAEIERMQTEAREETANSIDYRQMEVDSMNQLLAINDLKLYEIKPDGHCLFASIQDQLQQRHHIDKTIQELRDLSAEYILSHRDDFVPFLFDEQTCEIRDVDDYCRELTSTAMWGSDMEILALAKVFNCCIAIHMAGAATLKINEEANANVETNEDDVYGKQQPELQLGYYKHSYGLGEHYNSLRDA
ncbi:Otu2 protein [Candida orthopsilosis Co 90-125]|uniref:Otu2 protein n=1 Tax=Candida orthopsilosis (strain 90-125) TaxID=1136231 RepID=H8X886_CANO9|nr:Otu2 protein [Candida orthopsilosis Co 90-125]CCG24185.1 Otu2 protein [Candida orthopsilosis Co 90-125]